MNDSQIVGNVKDNPFVCEDRFPGRCLGAITDGLNFPIQNLAFKGIPTLLFRPIVGSSYRYKAGLPSQRATMAW